MKKWWILICTLVLMALSCLCAAEEEAQHVDFPLYIGTGETVQPDYPDWAPLIGEGLTKDDFDITFSVKDSLLSVSESGAVTYAGGVYRSHKRALYITYTPKFDGVGTETVFYCDVYTGQALTQIRIRHKDVLLGVGQSFTNVVEGVVTNMPKRIEYVGYDPDVVSVSDTGYDPTDDNSWFLFMKAIGAGNTKITLLGYNGVSAQINVKVMEAPTALGFAADEFFCYAGEKVELGGHLGSEDEAPNFSRQYVEHSYGKYPIDKFCSDGIFGYFTADAANDYVVYALTYNDISASTTIHVYDRESVVDMGISTDAIRVGDNDTYFYTYDALGKKVRPRNITITRGADIVSFSEDGYARKRLIPTGVGDFEVTVVNADGTTCVRTFTVEPYPQEINLNAEQITLEIGETFDMEVAFDQGWLAYTYELVEQDETDQRLGATRMEGDRIIAQAPGYAVYQVHAGPLSKQFAVTVRDGDKAIRIEGLEEMLKMGEGYQLYVRDKTGRIYPATFSLLDQNISDYATITAGGYLETLWVRNTLSVAADVADGRRLVATCSGIAKFPKWLRHEALVIRKSQRVEVEATSDVGRIDGYELTYKVANGNILSIEDSGLIIPKRTGTTMVTITSKRTGVSTTFTVEIISDTSTVYIGTTTMYVADGSKMYMPTVYDEKGREVTVKWVITHNNPGDGNPDKSGFTVEDDVISCHWPTASCEVTGTVKGSNEKVKVTVYGYRLPKTILLEPEQIWLKVGERKQLTVSTPQDGAKIVYTFWLSEPTGVVTMEETVYGTTNTISGSSEGVTLVAAMLENGAMAVSLVTVYDPDKRLPGDANGDGVVDIYDSLLVMQYDAGWSVAINGQQGDVNADGKTDLSDAVLILQYASGMNVQLRQYIPPQ